MPVTDAVYGKPPKRKESPERERPAERPLYRILPRDTVDTLNGMVKTNRRRKP
jgi:hypothetical protein